MSAVLRTQFFFDRFHSRIDQAAKSALSRFGAHVRQLDKSSLRYATKKRDRSQPGQVPVVHRAGKFTREHTNRKTGKITRRAVSPLKELTFFNYDPQHKSVVIGPAVFRATKTGGGVVTKVLEEGGSAIIRQPVRTPIRGGKATPLQAAAFKRHIEDGRIITPPRVFNNRVVRVAPRPHTKPAFDKEVPLAATYLRGTVST